MDELTARLNELEQQLQRLRRIVQALSVALLVALVSCATHGSAKEKPQPLPKENLEVLTVRKLVIVDQLGKPRIVAGTDRVGTSSIDHYDRDGKLRMRTLTRENRNAGLLLFDRQGKRRVGSLTLNDGSAGLLLRDLDGQTRLTVTTRSNSQAGIDHYDRDGKLRITAGTLPDSQANILHYDQSGIKRIMALTTVGGQVAIGVTGRDGDATWAEGTQ